MEVEPFIPHKPPVSIGDPEEIAGGFVLPERKKGPPSQHRKALVGGHSFTGRDPVRDRITS